MKSSLISISRHSACIIAGMLKQYSTHIYDSPATGDALIDELLGHEAAQADELREMLLEAIEEARAGKVYGGMV